jgi:fructose-bisphosphate aldolase class I
LEGTSFIKVMTNAGIIPGINVDTGAKDLAGHPGEKITEGLDGLRQRLVEYYKLGARFAKWRAVIGIGAGIPSDGCSEANAHALARYAALCQEGGLVPIVEPEVLMDGDHSIESCSETTEKVLRTVFNQLYAQRVAFESMILKPSMVVPGKEYPKRASVKEVADATVSCLLRAVPAAVCGIAFLSGGQGCALGGWDGSLPATWTPYQRWKSPGSVTASATNSASLPRRSGMAGRSRSQTNPG